MKKAVMVVGADLNTTIRLGKHLRLLGWWQVSKDDFQHPDFPEHYDLVGSLVILTPASLTGDNVVPIPTSQEEIAEFEKVPGPKVFIMPETCLAELHPYASRHVCTKPQGNTLDDHLVEAIYQLHSFSQRDSFTQ